MNPEQSFGWQNQLLQGDCQKLLPQLPDRCVDLIVTSPPYADQRKDTYGGVRPNEYVEWFLPIAAQLHRVLKTHRVGHPEHKGAGGEGKLTDSGRRRIDREWSQFAPLTTIAEFETKTGDFPEGIVIVITRDDIQEVARERLGRELATEELKRVERLLDWNQAVEHAIHEALDVRQ